MSRVKPIKRYAVFKDFRGVLYCEPVDEMLMVFERNVRAREPIFKWVGLRRKLAHPYRPAFIDTQVRFDDTLCNRDDFFHTTKFGPADPSEGWVRSPTKVYLQENFWGSVDAIHFITDLERGKHLQEALWALTPEGNRMVSAFDCSGLNQRDKSIRIAA